MEVTRIVLLDERGIAADAKCTNEETISKLCRIENGQRRRTVELTRPNDETNVFEVDRWGLGQWTPYTTGGCTRIAERLGDGAKYMEVKDTEEPRKTEGG
jgi:hypothetical protein